MVAYVLFAGQLIVGTALMVAVCTALERLNERGDFRLSARWPGVLFALLVPVFLLLVTVPLQELWGRIGLGPLLHLPLDHWIGPSGSFIFGIFFIDFLKYWEHRFEHRFLWPVHAVHHSPEELNAATSYSHPLQFVSMFLLISVPYSLIDLGAQKEIGLIAMATSVLPVLIHSPIRSGFGPFRFLLVDPPYHRIHHSIEKSTSIAISLSSSPFGTGFLVLATYPLRANGLTPASMKPDRRRL